MICVKDVLEMKKFLFQLEDGHNNVMIASSLSYIC